MELVIELFSSLKYKPLLKIFNQSRAKAGCFKKTKMSLPDFVNDIRSEIIYIACIKHKIVGYISISQVDNFIHHLYILPSFLRRGIGQALLQHCQHKHGLPLNLKCLKENEAACCFYETLGWKRKTTGVSSEGFYNLYWLK